MWWLSGWGWGGGGGGGGVVGGWGGVGRGGPESTKVKLWNVILRP